VKFRNRVAVTFAIASLGTLVAERLVTIGSFRRLQEYQLDQGLLARAKEEGNEVALSGRRALELEYAEKEETDPLEQLVTYGALYHADGTVVADTASFAHAPSLSQVGMPPARAIGVPFDFPFDGKTLRGVLVEVSSEGVPPPKYLLVAASRRDIDDDAQELLAVGWWIVVASLPFALALGWLLGRRMAKGLEALATAAGKVTTGELDLPPAADDQDEEVTALATALRDMVKRLNSHIEIERRFASHAAHELRSPLAALRAELELALRRPRTVAEHEATLQDALDDTNRLVDLAEDLLVVARTESGVIEGEYENVPPLEVVHKAVAASMARAPAQISVVASSDAAMVRGAPVALTRMVRNLIDNSVVHGGATDMRVRIAVEGPWLRIEVEDDGPGVPPEDRERVFEPFHRAANARREPGAGLGLGIAREIARRHGGDVVMDSAAKPTRFVALLPARVG